MTPVELKNWRDQQGLSQESLADLLGVHWMTVSRWELGKREIPPFLHLALETIDRRRRRRPLTNPQTTSEKARG